MFRPFNALALSMGLLLMLGCADAPNTEPEGEPATEDAAPAMTPNPNRLEIQGHRGARGLLPENTVPGFVLAIREGADVLELDLC
ncbi:MAG: glycerophosphodiester phosphodiesterase family protein, partial [Bacteroidota bacterium]|nr:glycerophosphodiester phosphodiesterase family protein [Bacteroidota bacterium]